jgi:succinate dehydrogenase / fumarate reductase flavoprotein subunit
LLLGAYSALMRQVGKGKVKMYDRHEMQDVVVVDGKARGIIARNLMTGEIERHGAHAVLLCTGGYGNVFFLSTNAMGSNVTAAWKAHKRGAYMANPCYTQIHPTCIPVSGTSPEQAHADERKPSQRRPHLGAEKAGGRQSDPRGQEERQRHQPRTDRDYYLERRYPASVTWCRATWRAAPPKERCDAGFGVNKTGEAVYLDFACRH